MQGFPSADDDRVTLANWQEPPYNRWAFSHMRELVPTQRISRGFEIAPLIPTVIQPLGDLQITRTTGEQASIDTVFAETYTDGVVVIRGGEIALEQYFGETSFDTPHLLMSVTKSFVGSVTGNLIAQGLMSVDDPVTRFVPELEGSGYQDATIRNVLDMRSGVKFSEDYTDPEAEVRVMEEAFGWRPATERDVPTSIYEYLRSIERAGEHGGAFEYRSSDTLVLGWVCERAASMRMSNLLSELIWIPMGADWDAELTCDSVGTGIHDGGMCATARDLARFGLVLLSGGMATTGRRVVPEEWLHASWSVDPDIRDAFSFSDSEPFLPGGWYRNKFWFVPRPHGDVLVCLGINGQMLYVNPGTQTVAAKVSSWQDAQSPEMLHDTLRVFDAIGAHLADLAPGRPTHEGPPGVAAGLSR